MDELMVYSCTKVMHAYRVLAATVKKYDENVIRH